MRYVSICSSHAILLLHLRKCAQAPGVLVSNWIVVLYTGMSMSDEAGKLQSAVKC